MDKADFKPVKLDLKKIRYFQAEVLMRNKIAELGHVFESRKAFWDFEKERLTRVILEKKEEKYFYLDFKDDNNRGTLIAIVKEDWYRFGDPEGANYIIRG